MEDDSPYRPAHGSSRHRTCRLLWKYQLGKKQLQFILPCIFLTKLDFSSSRTLFSFFFCLSFRSCDFTGHVYQDMNFNYFKLVLKLTWTITYYCRRQPHFFLSNLYLKHGNGSVYVMVDFICKGYLVRKSSENYKMKNSYQPWDSNPGPSAYEANALTLMYKDWCTCLSSG